LHPARVVAFDGIPVEVGHWTFESIKKSIQARGRPLTLSFRNDVLTPNQRKILMKAIDDLNSPKYGGEAVNQIIHENTIHTHSTSSISSSQHSPARSKQYYSLSEAGSSLASSVAPLVSNLLSSTRKEHADSTPEYLRRNSESLDQMKRHHEFQSGLL
jgi:hypothetical protein